MSLKVSELKDFFNSEEGKKSMEELGKKLEDESIEIKRFYDEDLDREVDHLSKEITRIGHSISLNHTGDEAEHKELGYDVEMIYKIVEVVFQYCDKTEIDEHNNDCPFPLEKRTYRGLTFSMMFGQGTLTRIYHEK